MRSTRAVSEWSSNLSGSNRPAFWFTMCFASSSMSLVTFTSWISSKYSAGPDLVGIAEQGPDQTLVPRLEGDDVLATGQHHPPDRDLVHLPDGLADHREGVVPDLAVRAQIVGPDQIARIDVAAVDEFVDLDGARRLQRDLLELLFRDLDVLAFLDLVALDDVLVGNLVA